MKFKLLIILLFTIIAAAKVTEISATNGIASWYGQKFAGKRTANGEYYNPEGYTCASRTYPMNTILSVVYPRKGTRVVVRVNDRGPWIKGRVIDLSERAAIDLGLRDTGIGYVIITPIDKLNRK